MRSVFSLGTEGDVEKQRVANLAYQSSNLEVTTMKMARLVLAVAAVATIWLSFNAESYAQRPGRGGPGAIRGVPLAGANRFGFARRPRRAVLGGNSIFQTNTGHEFARTIPRVFGDPILPYYSLYPPVYYSAPVPRPYGFSPFALPPGMQPAEGIPVPAAEPELTINPYFKPNQSELDEEAPSNQQTVAKPQFIKNPYYVKELTPEQSKRLAGTDEPEPNAVGLR